MIKKIIIAGLIFCNFYSCQYRNTEEVVEYKIEQWINDELNTDNFSFWYPTHNEVALKIEGLKNYSEGEPILVKVEWRNFSNEPTLISIGNDYTSPIGLGIHIYSENIDLTKHSRRKTFVESISYSKDYFEKSEIEILPQQSYELEIDALKIPLLSEGNFSDKNVLPKGHYKLICTYNFLESNEIQFTIDN